MALARRPALFRRDDQPEAVARQDEAEAAWLAESK
jgi:hypothetical protein